MFPFLLQIDEMLAEMTHNLADLENQLGVERMRQAKVNYVNTDFEIELKLCIPYVYVCVSVYHVHVFLCVCAYECMCVCSLPTT